jgi:hypothetical protein
MADANTTFVGSENRTADKAPKQPRGGGRTSVHKQVQEGLTGLYALTGTLVALANPYDGQIIILRAKAMAESLEMALRGNDAAYKVLLLITKSGAWLPLAMAYGSVGVGMAANHGLITPGAVDIFDLPRPPERPQPSERTNADGPEPLAANEYIPSDWQQAAEGEQPYYAPTGSASTVDAELVTPAPGLHVTQNQMDLIRAEAYRRAAAEQAQAAQRGADGMPSANPRG